MIKETLFEKRSTDEVEFVFGHAHNRRFQLDPARTVQHMGERD